MSFILFDGPGVGAPLSELTAWLKQLQAMPAAPETREEITRVQWCIDKQAARDRPALRG